MVPYFFTNWPRHNSVTNMLHRCSHVFYKNMRQNSVKTWLHRWSNACYGILPRQFCKKSRLHRYYSFLHHILFSKMNVDHLAISYDNKLFIPVGDGNYLLKHEYRVLLFPSVIPSYFVLIYQFVLIYY